MTWSASRALPVAVLLVSFLLGLGINWLWGPHLLSGDEPDYQRLADQFARTGAYGWPGFQAVRAPLYPVLLGLVYRGLGPDPWGGRILQSVLGALMVLCTFLIARRLAGPRAGLLASSFMVLDSYWWLNQVELMQENLLAVLLGVSFLLIWAAVEPRGWDLRPTRRPLSRRRIASDIDGT